MIRLSTLILCFLTGCTISIIDDRLSRTEVAEAFAKRDKTLSTLIADYNARVFPEGTPTPTPTAGPVETSPVKPELSF